LERSQSTLSPLESPSCLSASLCPGVSEKNAASLPDIRAEQIIRPSIEKERTRSSIVMLLGGSKFLNVLVSGAKIIIFL
jgi:hypothetical protein